jgi:arylsulfatase A-like enzyme
MTLILTLTITLTLNEGTLFEGGTKVESFIFSNQLPATVKGTEYSGLFHVSDWFSTILNIANISYNPMDGHELDGYDQYPSITRKYPSSPREFMLYNSFYNVENEYFDLWKNGTTAIRNSRYKLMHTFLSPRTR